MKTTKKDFEDFKAYGEEFIDKLGLKDWSIVFMTEDSDEVYGAAASNVGGRVATISLSKSWDERKPKTPLALRRLALHEVLHVLFAPILKEAKERYTMQYVIDDLEHDVIRRLENMVDND